ncbi:hypothetical protein [Nocardia aobensis]|uniref:hypothetical protein n=1 Tax=Nocardia aobensis TaxID=257277 RepID=UPI00031DB79B|nr:hypothetical protein [Nocardia aobensis]
MPRHRTPPVRGDHRAAHLRRPLAATRAATTGVTAVDLPGAEPHTARAAAAWTDGFHRPTADDPARVISSYHPNFAGMTATADYLTRQSPR